MKRSAYSFSGDAREADPLKTAGRTENPIKAISYRYGVNEERLSGCPECAKKIKRMCATGRSLKSILRSLQVSDAQRAAREFWPIYRESLGRDGHVIVEAAPMINNNTAAIVREAFYTWRRLRTPNAMLSLPATDQHIAAIRKLSCAGVNTRVCGIYTADRYLKVAEAYIAGLEARHDSGERLDQLLSEVHLELLPADRLFNPILSGIALQDGPRSATARRLTGQVAIANACLIYLQHRELFGGEKFRRLAAFGAHPHRLVWSNTCSDCFSFDPLKYLPILQCAGRVSPLTEEMLTGNINEAIKWYRKDPSFRCAADIFDRLKSELKVDPGVLLRKLEHRAISLSRDRYQRLLDVLGQKVDGFLTLPVAYKKARTHTVLAGNDI